MASNETKFNNSISRNTLYFDESGVGSFNDKKRYFILTAIIANNNDFHQLSEYYFRLKLKHFKENKPIHSYDLFWEPKINTQKFIPELTEYLETVPFGILTVVIDKERILRETTTTEIRYPYRSTFTQAISIWKKSGLAKETFASKTIKEVIDVIGQYEIPDIDNHYPLKIAYKTILKEYINNYAKKFSKNEEGFEICFETSPNRERILKYTESFYNERKTGNPSEKTSFAEKLKNSIYSISFPNKSSRYLGLEIADMVSYGFSLSKYKRFDKVPYFKPIWNTISKKRTDLKKEFGVDCLIELPKPKRKKQK